MSLKLTNWKEKSTSKILSGCHVQYTGTLAPLQYLSTSYDTDARPCILQRWIEATIYNHDESLKIWKLCK